MDEVETLERWKRYRAYLTRRSKWEAIRLCLKHEQVGAIALRGLMHNIGERAEDLDAKWEKRILGDTKLFRLTSNGNFFELADDLELGKCPTWVGERPWQNFVSDAYDWVLANVATVGVDLSKARVLLNNKWDQVSRVIVMALDGLRKKRVEEPLTKLSDFAWDLAMVTSAKTHNTQHAISLWLTVTRIEVDAYTRLRAYIAAEGDRPWDVLGQEDGHGSPIYSPMSTGYLMADGGYEKVDVDQTPKAVLQWIRQRLVYRRILKGRD